MTSIHERRARSVREPHGHLVVTERTRAILRTLARCRLLGSRDLALAHFASKSHADRILRKMFDTGLVARIERPVVFGSAELLYAITGRGAALTADGDEPEPMGRLVRRSARQLDHLVGLGKLRLLLERGASDVRGFAIERWIWSPMLAPGRTRHHALIPDAAFFLRSPRGTKSALCFLEHDTGTEGPAAFRAKLAAYANAHAAGLVKDRFGADKFRVLTVTSTPSRRDRLVALGSGIDPTVFFWFSTMADASAPAMLTAPTWRVTTNAGVQTYAL